MPIALEGGLATYEWPIISHELLVKSCVLCDIVE